jgi:hypothetical protein
MPELDDMRNLLAIPYAPLELTVRGRIGPHYLMGHRCARLHNEVVEWSC